MERVHTLISCTYGLSTARVTDLTRAAVWWLGQRADGRIHRACRETPIAVPQILGRRKSRYPRARQGNSRSSDWRGFRRDRSSAGRPFVARVWRSSVFPTAWLGHRRPDCAAHSVGRPSQGRRVSARQRPEFRSSGARKNVRASSKIFAITGIVIAEPSSESAGICPAD